MKNRTILKFRLNYCRVFLLSAVAIYGSPSTGSADTSSIVSAQKQHQPSPSHLPGRNAPLLISSEDWPGVIRAFTDLQTDIGKVTGITPKMIFDKPPRKKEMVIAGTVGKSRIIDNLSAGKINVCHNRQMGVPYTAVTEPFPGVKRALVIAGSDKRGTIYGIYELSEQIGVSPWHWWAECR